MEGVKNGKVMLAIVIPYFKFTFFNKTLESLVNQTDKRFNVYIGDDASTESPLKLLEKYQNQLNYVYHRFDKNLGSKALAKQWERCINLIKDEDWIMILGDDDYLSKNVVASWYEQFHIFNTKTNHVRFSSKVFNQDTNSFSEVYNHPIWENAVESFWRKYKNETRISLSEHIFRSETYKKHGFKNFPLAWNSDDCAWLDFAEGKPIYTINDCIVYIGFSSLNISGKNDNLILKKESYILFYRYIISKKTKLFSKKEILSFMFSFEFEILKQRRLTASEWLFLFFNHLKNFDFIESKKFIKRFLNTVLRRYE